MREAGGGGEAVSYRIAVWDRLEGSPEPRRPEFRKTGWGTRPNTYTIINLNEFNYSSILSNIRAS